MDYKKPWKTTETVVHPYLTRKGVPLGEGCKVESGVLKIPMSTGFYQEIYEDGRKHFPKGSKKGWYRIDGKAGVVLIAEGYATAYSVHLATRATCYVSFDAGQLTKTAQEARTAFPDADIIIAGDRDESGLAAAEKAALAVQGTVTIPPKGDWNDFWLAEGKAATVQALNDCQYEPEKPEPTLPDMTYYPPANSQDFSSEDVAAMLSHLSPDCSNQDWVIIGMAVKRGGFDCGLWDRWSAGSAKYKKGECWTRWKSFGEDGAVHFGTLVHLASKAGWSRPQEEYDPVKERGYALDTVPVDLVALANRKLVKAKEAGVKASNTIDIDPLQLPGLIGDTVRWICEDAIYEQPLLALMNTIAFAGAVVGRIFEIEGLKTRGNIYFVATDTTGCHAKGTGILMFDGSVKNVEDIVVGNVIMGDDSTPRNVLKLARGKEQMYRIIPIKGEPFVVNENHVLSLMNTSNGDVVNIEVKDYVKKSEKFKHLHKLNRSAVNFPSMNPPKLDPWFVGAMIGDGYFVQSPILTSADSEILEAATSYAKSLGITPRLRRLPNGNKASSLRFVHSDGRKENKIRDGLKELGLWGKTAEYKFIPDQYKLGSKETRMAVLSGLLDTDGSVHRTGYDFITKSKKVAQDVQFIARSLGFSAHLNSCKKFSQLGSGGTYWRVGLSGNMSILPLKISRKKVSERRQKKSVLRTGFTFESVGVDDFYGFSLDGNHLYLTSDFMVHHNSGKDHSRKKIKELAGKCDMNKYLGSESVRSESGIARSLTIQASQLMMVDEFGMLLKTVSNEKAAHLNGVMRLITTLYSEIRYDHGVFSDAKKEQFIINRPNLCIYGVTTEETYVTALKMSSVASGELNRFIVLPNHYEPIRRRYIPDTKVPIDLEDRWRELNSLSTGVTASNSGSTCPIPTKVSLGECEERAYEIGLEQDKKRKEKNGALWVRYCENTLKIALLFSVLESPHNPIITMKWLNIADSIVRYSIKYMLRLIDSNIAESQYHGWQQEIIKELAKKGEMSQSDLRRVMRKIEPRKFAELLSDMEQYGILVRGEKKQERGRPSTVFRLSESEG